MTDQPKIKLYGYPTSPFVNKVGCYLKYKKLDFEFVPVDPIKREQIKFSRQRQVPVLTIGEGEDMQWKADSPQIGRWLDERFADKPLLGANDAERAQILEIDAWASEWLLTARFRAAVYWVSAWDSIRNGWVLSSAMNNAISIPLPLRFLYPWVIKRTGFIKNIIRNIDLDEPHWDMHERLAGELVAHLADGPYMGGLGEPSLVDLSAYSTVIFPYLIGLHGRNVYLERPEIVEWCKRVQAHLPENPLLVPDSYLKRSLLG